MGRSRPVRPPAPDNPPLTVTPVTPNPTEYPPDRNDDTSRQSTREITIDYATNRAIPVIYGTCRVGGRVFFRKIDSTGRLVVGYLLSWGECNSLTNANITIGGQSLASIGLVNATSDYNIRLGTTGQSISYILDTYETQWTSSLPGMCYVVLRFQKANSDWNTASVNPNDFLATVQGVKVLDPRSGVGDPTLTTKFFRNNPALALADIMTNASYGGRIPTSRIDWDTVGAAADFCDYDIDPGAGETKRYTFDFAMTEQTSLAQAIELFRSHAQLYVVWDSGKYKIYADQAKSVSGIQYTESDIQSATMRLRGVAEVPNHIEVSYTDAAKDYADGRAESARPAADDGTEERVTATYDNPGATTYDQAKRMSIYLLNRALLDKEVTLSVLAAGIRPLPGDIIEVTSQQLNFSVQKVLVSQISTGNDGSWQITGEIYDASIYNDTIQTETPVTIPSIPSPYDVPPWPGRVTYQAKSLSRVTQGTSWETIPIRPLVLYTSGYWTGTDLNNYTASQVNDGNHGTKAFDLNSAVGTDRSLKLDLGSGNTAEFRELVLSFSGTAAPQFAIQYSDNDVDWNDAVTDVDLSLWHLRQPNGTEYSPKRCVNAWGSVGSHRYWRLYNVQTAATDCNVWEVQFYTFEGEWPFAKRVLLSGTAANPLTASVGSESPATRNIETAVLGEYTITGPGGYDSETDLQLSVESEQLRLSDVVQFYDSASVAPSIFEFTPDEQYIGEQYPTLSTGDNNNVVIDSSLILIVLNSVGAAFAVTGFAGNSGGSMDNEGGRVHYIYNNTAYTCTLKNEDANSSAINRLDCGGSNISLVAGASASMIRSKATDRWITRLL